MELVKYSNIPLNPHSKGDLFCKFSPLKGMDDGINTPTIQYSITPLL
jgi:hypothetical protein